jgi:hypothetical protein
MPTQQERDALQQEKRRALQRRIDLLKAAYEWEQKRLKTWRDEAVASVSPEESNPMIRRFLDTWKSYIQEVWLSNQSVIASLEKAVRDPVEEFRDPMVERARTINREEHRKGSIRSIANVVNAHRHQSDYFKSLDAVIDLENEVRDYIERFLADEPAGGEDADRRP